MKTNPYYIKARLFPTALTAIPVIVFYANYVAPIYSDRLANVFSVLPTLTTATFSAAIVFLLTQVNRLLAKEVFQRLHFKDDLGMPTTNYLMWKDSFFDDATKLTIRNLVSNHYGLTLKTREEEVNDDLGSRRMIATAVSQIRISLKDNPMLLQHNIEYGFFRNFIGGSVLALVFAFLILIISMIQQDSQMQLISVVMLVIYLAPVLLSGLLIKRFGSYYAKILYDQFISLRKISSNS